MVSEFFLSLCLAMKRGINTEIGKSKGFFTLIIFSTELIDCIQDISASRQWHGVNHISFHLPLVLIIFWNKYDEIDSCCGCKYSSEGKITNLSFHYYLFQCSEVITPCIIKSMSINYNCHGPVWEMWMHLIL